MERQEFDLNDYSLEVRDGKAVLERKESKEPQEFEDGAFLVDAEGYIFIHWTGGDDDGGLGSLVYWNPKTDDMFIELANSVVDTGRLATDDEKKSLLDRLAKDGYEWDSEKKMLRKKRWRANEGERYWYISSGGVVSDDIEMYSDMSDGEWELGNYFRTKEKAEEAAEEVRKVFEKYKEE